MKQNRLQACRRRVRTITEHKVLWCSHECRHKKSVAYEPLVVRCKVDIAYAILKHVQVE